MTFTGVIIVYKKSMDLNTKVKKPVEAIQCVNTFSLLQRKMYNVLLANAADNLHSNVTHRIDMRVLCSLMGYRSNDYKTIKIKFRELRRMDIEWDTINENGNKVWTNTSPLSLAKVIEGDGICKYEFTPSLVPFLERPAQYAKFSLAIQAKFKSCYGLALYENCERYKKIGYTRAFDIPMFRRLMGVGEEEYLEFFTLKQRVICKAVKEVNKHADFDIEPEYEKNGRNVVSIRFLIKPKEKKLDSYVKSSSIEAASKEEELSGKIIKYFGLSEKAVCKYFKKYGTSYVGEKVDVILSSEIFKKGLINSMAGYLKTALAEDYQPIKSSQVVLEEQRREKEFFGNLSREKHDLICDLQRKYKKHISENVSEIVLSKLTEENRGCLLENFKSYIAKTYYSDIYDREGMENIMVRDRFVEFMTGFHIKLLNSLLSFKSYIQKNHPEKKEQLESLLGGLREKEAY